MLEKGIPVMLGTDGASSNNNLNMFEEMHLAAVVHNGVARDPIRIGAYDALKMACRSDLLGFDSGQLLLGKSGGYHCGGHQPPAFSANAESCQ